MKILIVANYNLGKGGISGVIRNHMSKLASEGFKVEIFNTKKNPFRRLFLVFPLIKKVRRFDVIHIHGCSGLGFYPIFIGIIVSKIILKKRTIITYHGGGAETFFNKHIIWARWMMKKADHVTVMSEFLQNIFYNYKIETVILKNLINIEIKKESKASFDTPRLLSIRSLTPVYNIQDIISAFQLIRKNYPEATLQIAGSGPQEVQLKELSKHTTGITFVGQIPNEEIPTLMNQNNILITVPSLDNQPMSILEAFSVSIPVISSHVGGVPDLIKDSFNGFLVDTHSPEQISEKVKWIFSHQNQVHDILENAKKSIRIYQWPEVKKTLLTLYQN
jgi:glycosyltransferase involved in cell wall biosynthesis